MIYRIWKASARSDRLNEYIRHLETETFPMLRTISGFVEAVLLADSEAGANEEVAVQVITVWNSEAAIKAFAGEDARAAVVPDVARAMMHHADPRAEHFELLLRA